MPLQVEYDLKNKEEALYYIVEALMDSSKPKDNARSLKGFIRGDENLKSHYETLFKHELLSNFNDMMDGRLKAYDAGDIILLADKPEAEERIEDKVYKTLRAELAD